VVFASHPTCQQFLAMHSSDGKTANTTDKTLTADGGPGPELFALTYFQATRYRFIARQFCGRFSVRPVLLGDI
jgi:hypothetical protein